MADFEIERAFVLNLWSMVDACAEPDLAHPHPHASEAGRLTESLAPEMFEHPRMAAAFQHASECLVRGDGASAAESVQRFVHSLAPAAPREGAVWQENMRWVAPFMTESFRYADDPVPLAAKIHRDHTQRIAVLRLADAADDARKMLEAGDRARGLELIANGLVHSEEALRAVGSRRAPLTPAELVAAEEAAVLHPEDHARQRVSWPWPKLHAEVGPIVGGRTYGITAYSGQGKSALAANLFAGLTRRGVPCIVAATEMDTDWLRMAWAAEADVPQDVAQNQLWDENDSESIKGLCVKWGCGEHEVLVRLRDYRDRYLHTFREYRDPTKRPFEFFSAADMAPEQVISRAKRLRRQWPRRLVVLIIDHAHDLKYPENKADLHVGVGMSRLRDFAAEDGDVAVVACLQPKKPENPRDDSYLCQPVSAQQVRGQVAQSVHVHMSIYRSPVLTTHDRTPWGTPLAATHPETGLPRWCKLKEAEEKDEATGLLKGKLDDERMYILPDKKRIGGRGKTVVLDFRSPSSQVWERAYHRTRDGRGRVPATAIYSPGDS